MFYAERPQPNDNCSNRRVRFTMSSREEDLRGEDLKDLLDARRFRTTLESVLRTVLHASVSLSVRLRNAARHIS